MTTHPTRAGRPSEQQMLEAARPYLDRIAARMAVEGAEDTSDAELQRTLGGCVLAGAMIRYAEALRASGELWPAIERIRASA